MKLAFDEHVPAGIVKVFQVLAAEGAIPPVTEVVKAADYTQRSDGGGDDHWVHRFADDGGSVIICGDKKMRGRPHEQKALLDEKMIVFFFAPKWNEANGFVKSAMLLNWWPKVADTILKGTTPGLYEIPFQWTWTDLKQKQPPQPGRQT